MEIESLLERRRDEILRIAEKYGASDIRIFGSVARKDSRADSDIDLFVKFAPHVSLLDHTALWQEIGGASRR